MEHPNQEGDTCIEWTSQYCWTNGWNCLWRGHSVYRNRPLIPQTPRSLCGSRGAAPPPPPSAFLPPAQEGTAATPTPHPPPLAGGQQRMGRPRRCHRWRQKRNPHPMGGGGGSTRGQPAASPARGGGRAGGPQPALGELPSHGRRQATGASRVARALHPPQAQGGSRGRGGQHGKQGASPRVSPPSCSRRPLALGFTRAATMALPRDEGQG